MERIYNERCDAFMTVAKRKRLSEDLSGRKFNQLTVLHRVDNYVSPSGTTATQYACLCDCGKESVVRAVNLKSGKTVSCGCSRKKYKGKLEDLTGRTFHRWTVMHRAESITEPSGRKATMWHCRCDCGTEKAIRARTLKSGESKSCGCLKTESLSVVRDLEGQSFGRWVVIGQQRPRPGKGRTDREWLCRCSCGTERFVLEQSLVRNLSVSCGCYRLEQLKDVAEFEDLSGRTFGVWLVLHRVADRFYPSGGRAQMWLCRCVCGAENEVAGQMLKPGISQSCGCLGGSVLERHVSEYLDEKTCCYKRKQTFNDLNGVGGRALSYDFAVYTDDGSRLLYLIECQGEQHYRPVKYFGGHSKFKTQQTHDLLKRKYAQDIDVPLIEIKYSCRTRDDISQLLDTYLLSII